MQCLGEMATWLPLPGAVPQYCSRYVDEAMGFAVGWNNWYSNALTLCAEISAASVVIGFWNTSINPAAWISIIWVLVICLNIFAVSIYGEAEFIFASIKLITIVGLLLLALIIDLGGAPGEGRLGFSYWVSVLTCLLVAFRLHASVSPLRRDERVCWPRRRWKIPGPMGHSYERCVLVRWC